MNDRIAYQGITFDDVLLEPAYSDVVPRDVLVAVLTHPHRRVGDTRTPDVWFAWGEAAPGHGSRPLNRLPGLGTRVGINFKKY
jgi:hypothetical protein